MYDIFNLTLASIKRITDKRILTLVGVLCGAFSLFLFFSESFSYYLSYLLNIPISKTSIPAVFLLFSVLVFSFLYLQSGAKEAPEKYNDLVFEKLVKELSSQNQWAISQVEELKKKVESYEIEKGLTAEERKLMIASAVDQIGEDAVKTIFKSETIELNNKIKESLGFDRLVDASKDIVMRLRREIQDLRLRSNINLLIGMSITAIGVYLLWSTVSMVDASQLLKQLASEGDEANMKFFKNLTLPIIPRIMLVIFIEVFAYFFLRLYKSGLDEIKYFQNELTNIESKLAAVEFSYITNNQEGLRVSIAALSNTERNFVLEKGQTTVELERAKSDSELTKNILKTIPSIFGKAKS